MAKIKIVFRKQVWADINAYYPSFPVGLRKAIDNALFRLMGGEEAKTKLIKATPKVNNHNKFSLNGATKSIILRRTKRLPLRENSKTYALVAKFAPGTEVLKDDVIKAAVSMHGMKESYVLFNLLRDKYFEVVE